jgi:C1A family cysteine protease
MVFLQLSLAFRGLTTISRPTQDEETSKRVQATLDTMVGVTIPTTLDYTNYNGQDYLTSVKNQGSCGCCWSFAATAQYESLLKLNGFSYDLST